MFDQLFMLKLTIEDTSDKQTQLGDGNLTIRFFSSLPEKQMEKLKEMKIQLQVVQQFTLKTNREIDGDEHLTIGIFKQFTLKTNREIHGNLMEIVNSKANHILPLAS